MTDDELAEALSSDFTCSAAPAEEKKTSPTEVLIFVMPLPLLQWNIAIIIIMFHFKMILTILPSFLFLQICM